MLKTAVKLLLGRGSIRSYGQFGEDAIVQRILKRGKGVYVDVGAYHPVLYSNTYALYRRGWSGLVIDPNYAARKLFRVFRPRDTFVHAGVAGSSGTKDYFEYQDPAYNSFVGQKGMKPDRTIKVQVRTLKDIVGEHKLTRVDFLNVDVEGMDAEVLASHDWSIKPTVIAVESQLGDPAVKFLEEKGYKLAGKAGLTLVFRLT